MLIEIGLKDAIDNKKLTIVYQAIFSVEHQEIVACEALCRWYHPDFGDISATEIICIAEHSGLIHALDAYVCEQVFIDSIEHIFKHYPNLHIHINLSIKQLDNDSFITFIESAIDKFHIEPKKFVFELIETDLIQDLHLVEERVQALHKMGLMVIVDDFGMGYSSLGKIKDLPVRSIKISKNFVDKAIDDKDTSIILQSMIHLANSLEMHPIAVGVETQRQLDFLRASDCPFVQGYIFAEPMALDDFMSFLNNDIS